MEKIKEPEFVLDIYSATQGLTSVRKDIHSFMATYVLFHEASGMFYVGSTRCLYRRITEHLKGLRSGKHGNHAFQGAYDKYQNKNLRVSFIRSDDREHGFSQEQAILDKYVPSGKLFNLATDARVSGLGRIVSEEQKQSHSLKIREYLQSTKGKEQLELSARMLKARWNSPELSKKWRKDRAERKTDPAYLKMLADAGRSVWTNPELRSKMLEIRAKRRRPVTINGIDYDSVGTASKELGIPLITLRKRLERGYPNHHFTTEKGNTNVGSE